MRRAKYEQMMRPNTLPSSEMKHNSTTKRMVPKTLDSNTLDIWETEKYLIWHQ